MLSVNTRAEPKILPNVVRQGVIHRLAELRTSLVVQLLVAGVCARAELVDGRLELVMAVRERQLTPNGK